MSQNPKLNFISTNTITEFKATTGATSIKVMRNPETGKLFFATVGGKQNITGAVSGDEVPANPMVSEVEGTEGKFFMIHKEGSSLEAVATL